MVMRGSCRPGCGVDVKELAWCPCAGFGSLQPLCDDVCLIHVILCQRGAKGHARDRCGPAARKRFFLGRALGGANGLCPGNGASFVTLRAFMEPEL